jgi:hypothetical protein
VFDEVLLVELDEQLLVEVVHDEHLVVLVHGLVGILDEGRDQLLELVIVDVCLLVPEQSLTR